MVKLRFRKSSAGLKAIYIAFLLLFTVCALIYLYPMFWAIINSLKSEPEYAVDTISMPTEWLWDNWGRVFTDFAIASGNTHIKYFGMLGNSLWILAVYVFVNLLSSLLLAYALAKFNFPGKNFLYAVVIFANTIPIIGSGPAAFKLAYQLNMINNPFLIWIQWASGFDFAFIVFYGYFKGISPAYSESAKIDGANNATVLFRIILPQIVPCVVAIGITQAVTIWNNYSISMIYMTKYPNLSYGLYLFQNGGASYMQDSTPTFFAAAVISCIPIIILYASTQNLILKNVTTGGLKG